MKIDPHHLRVAEVVRLLNSTPLGEVVQPQTVYRHQNRAPTQIGDGKRIDLLKYTAWLFWQRQEMLTRAAEESTNGGYEAHRELINARGRIGSESVRDIAPEGWVTSPRQLWPADDWVRDGCGTSAHGYPTEADHGDKD